jgi:uncharacterized damage-inducible protein DinB
MDDLTATIATGFVSHVERFAARVHELAEPLADEQFWRRPYPYGNSFGHLVLHLTGNLSHYIGAHIAQTGYLRNRELEFTDARQAPKAETLANFDAAVALVIATINAQSAADWAKEYAVEGMPHTRNRFEITLNCVAHLHHHIGQMIYLAKELTR